MALNGTIQEFGVADIFQLIGGQGKTGVLRLRSGGEEVSVTFKQGAVVSAENSKTPAQHEVGLMMVAAEVFTAEQLAEATKLQQKKLIHLGRALVDIRAADEATVREFLLLQLKETLYGLFEWVDGQYAFEATEVEPSPDGLPAIPTENLILDGSRRVDEWPSIKDRIPDFSWPVERMRVLPPAGQKNAEAIGSAERAVYALLDRPGALTVRRVIELSRLGRFEACEALAQLQSRGYVRIIKPGPKTSTSQFSLVPTGSQRLGLRRGRIWALRIAISLVLSWAGVWVFLKWGPVTRAQSEVRYRESPVKAHLGEAQLRVLRRTLEVYRHQTGAYPSALSALVEGGFLKTEALRFPYDLPYGYQKLPSGGFVLLKPLH